jgi:hypothetical protein
VPRELGEAFASSRGWLYAETSAKDGLGVQELFEKTALEVLSRPELLEALRRAEEERAQRALAVSEQEQRQEASGRNRSYNLGCIVS